MRWLATLGGAAIVLIVLWDAFETVLLPRRVTRRLRLSTTFQKTLWQLWSAVGRRIRGQARRETYLGTYAVLALIALIGVWAVGLVVGFGLIRSGAGTRISPAPGSRGGLTQALYLSGSTLFTLGIGDVVPLTAWGRFVTVVESGVGLGFVAVLLAYLPVLYQSFSRREVRLSMLDEVAGSPPRAIEILRRAAAREKGGEERAADFFRDWELWSAEILESHLSYPLRPAADGVPRVRAEHLDEMRELLAYATIAFRDPEEASMHLRELVAGYQPYAEALADHLLMPLPPVEAPPEPEDNWQRSPWEVFRPERRVRR